MYFTQLPDHNVPGFDEQAHFHRFGKYNMIFNALSRTASCSNHVGCLSLKTVFYGEEWYFVDGHSVAVRPGQFLILNNDQNYSCQINRDEGARTFSVFFEKQFAAGVLNDLLRSDEKLVDDPFHTFDELPEFFQTLHSVELQLASRLSSLVGRLDRYGYDGSFVDEYLLYLLGYLIRTYRSDTMLLRKINAVRSTTQKELFKRVCVARDILHSCYQAPLDLTWLSRQVCLSMPQLIRQFRTVFTLTPYQYLMDLRLRHAAQLLLNSSLAVQEIVWRCGYADMSAFCRVFKAVYGIPPERFRRDSGTLSRP